MPIAVDKLPLESGILQRVRYDVASPSFLFWREFLRGNPRLDALHIRQFANKPAGCLLKTGYWVVAWDGKRFLAHRLIWKMHHGTEPAEVDHIDGNPLNNRIENLRPADRSISAMNSAARKGTKTGVRGVYPSGDRFFARITAYGVMHHLGSFPTVEEAHAAYCAASERLHGAFGRTS